MIVEIAPNPDIIDGETLFNEAVFPSFLFEGVSAKFCGVCFEKSGGSTIWQADGKPWI